MLGGLTRVSAINPSEFAWRVADRLFRRMLHDGLAVYTPDARTRGADGQPGIAEVFHPGAIAGHGRPVGGRPDAAFGLFRIRLLTREEITSLEAARAVGDLLCHFIDAVGQRHRPSGQQAGDAVDPLSLRGTRQIVLASGGWHKLTVIRAALKMLRPTVLVVNEVVAERLAVESR